MRAIDTNAIIRFLTDDDQEQSACARWLVAAGDLFVPTTGVLESEWVLRNSYRLSPTAIAGLIETFVGLPTIHVGDPERLAIALGWASADMDFADAMHLASAGGCTAFVGFDRALAKTATGLATVAITAP